MGKKRILITGGGTGGHVHPSLSVIAEIKKTFGEEEVEFIYVGSGNDIERVIRDDVKRSYTIATGKFRRYFSWRNFTDIFRVIIGFAHSLIILFREYPDVVFSKGGYVSVPVVIAAFLYHIPIVLHESDARPGLANRVLGKLSKKVALGYDEARSSFLARTTVVTGNPVSETVMHGDPKKARELFGLSTQKPILLVLGGSQGSHYLNERVAMILGEIVEYFQVIHQTGKENYNEAVRMSLDEANIKVGERGYYVYPFLNQEQVRAAYAIADIVVARSGATTIAELAANHKVAILVPLANSANNHQRMNAYAVARIGGAVVLEEANLTKHLLLEKIGIVFKQENREKMQRAITNFYAPNASADIAEIVVGFLKK